MTIEASADRTALTACDAVRMPVEGRSLVVRVADE
jgi:hypothetical protein